MAKKNKPVEVIDLDKLPKLETPGPIHIRCANCAHESEVPAKFRGFIVRCQNCGWNQYA